MAKKGSAGFDPSSAPAYNGGGRLPADIRALGGTLAEDIGRGLRAWSAARGAGVVRLAGHPSTRAEGERTKNSASTKRRQNKRK